jgi:PadR family transcriptional regulator PadR
MAEILGAFEQAVLVGVVHLGEDAYGRAILRESEERLGRDVSAGAIYATLDRLEARGLLTSRLDDSTPGRTRRYYKISARGVTSLNESRSALRGIWAGVVWPVRRA